MGLKKGHAQHTLKESLINLLSETHVIGCKRIILKNQTKRAIIPLYLFDNIFST